MSQLSNTESETSRTRRVVSRDPGLMTPEQLLAAQGGRRRSLESLIAHNNESSMERRNKSNFFAKTKENVRWFLDHARARISYDDFMMLVTIFVLFGDDVRLLSLPPSTDEAYDFLVSLSFFLFLIELILTSWAKSDFSKGFFKAKGYIFSFFFWLDVLAIVSMTPDLKWLSLSYSIGVDQAGKATRIGAKTSRVIRMARLVRLVKLYKVTSQRRREKKLFADLTALSEQGHLDVEDLDKYIDKMDNQKQSKVGAELSDIITRRVIVAVLLMLCIVPLLSYSPHTNDKREATNFLHEVNINSATNCDYLLGSTNEFKEFMNGVTGFELDHLYLVSLSVKPSRCNSTDLIDFENSTLLSNIRQESIVVMNSTTEIINGVEHSVNAIFNMRYFLEEESLSSIYLTIFIIFMLISLSAQFTGDAQKLVLAPIESMMEMVNMVSQDPLHNFDFHFSAGEYETRVVQVAIQKITSLLRVGFGVAGADIISTNMSVEEGSNVLEPMIPGKRMYAIFGFCDIHAFDHCTEKLEDEIMTFVNSVARIVHGEVARWGGLCNKNLGNAFLMVWRIGNQVELQEFTGKRKVKKRNSGKMYGSIANGPSSPLPSFVVKSNTRTVAVDLRRIPGLDTMSDKALIGFLKVIVEVNRDEQVLAYRGDERLKCGDDAFKLRMGFGLNAGWAIEGAVGSLQKVDATYLSPHVNMAARMEAASRQFGVSILMTERFHELMSEEAQSYCRKIDVVTVKGSAIPMPIYTYDTFQNQDFPTLTTPKFSCLSLADVLKQEADEYDPLAWEMDEDLVQLRRLATPEFNKIFKEGLNNYLNGDWSKAQELLENANAMMIRSDINGDGPSQTILKYMSAREWQCPSDWKGYRPLTSK